MNRRNFLRVAGLTGVGGLLVACTRSVSKAPVAPTKNWDAINATLDANIAKQREEIATQQAELDALKQEASATAEPVIVTNTAAAPTVKETAMNGVEAYQIVETEKVNGWTINWTDQARKDRGDGTTYEQWAKATYPEWSAVKPELWPTAPNVPNPLVPEFKTADGMEIPDSGLRNFCQEIAGNECTVPVAAGAYFEYTGDGEIPGLWKSKDGMGNALVIVNVGDVTADFTGTFLQGWALKDGRYFKGGTLPIGIVATISHADNNMLNKESTLNPGEGLPNAGANCSVREGCKKVHNTVIIMSGGAPLLIADSEVSK